MGIKKGVSMSHLSASMTLLLCVALSGVPGTEDVGTLSLDDSLILSSTEVAAERAEAEYQVTALTYDSNIALDGKDAHFNIQVDGQLGSTGSVEFGVGPDEPGMIVRKLFTAPDVGEVRQVQISSTDSRSIVVFKWFKVKLNSMYWYAEMPYLVNITAGMPTKLEAVAVRCEASTC